MKRLSLAFAMMVLPPVWAQTGGPNAPSAPADAAQRRAELRQLLQHQRDQRAPGDAQRQLTAQERAELRELLRQQRRKPVRREAGRQEAVRP